MWRPHVWAAFLLVALQGQAFAAPAIYVLETESSKVRFETSFGPDLITGQMPVTKAELTLDFDQVSNCKVAVTVDAGGATANFPFAAQAMKGPKVLDAAKHPAISFESTSVTRTAAGATVAGFLTIRGVRQPMQFNATIWRKAGSEQGDLSHLTVRLTGAVLRSTYGATGWADMVGDEVRLDILARIVRKE